MAKKIWILNLILAVLVIVGIATLPARYPEMDAKAKEAASGSRYVVVTDVKNHLTRVYATKDYSVVCESKSCGAKKQRYGEFAIKKHREPNRDGIIKVNGESVYNEYYVTKISNGNAIHTVLYSKAAPLTYYDEEGIQDANDLFGNNWSNGCTRTDAKLAKFVYDNCEEGTPYIIF